MGPEGQKELEKNQHKTRVPKWSIWETLLGVQVVVPVRDKYTQVIGNPEMMCEFNRVTVYMDLVDEYEKKEQCGGQDHG